MARSVVWPQVFIADEVNEQHHEFFAEKPTQYRSAEELNLLSSAACGSCYSGRSRSNEMNSRSVRITVPQSNPSPPRQNWTGYNSRFEYPLVKFLHLKVWVVQLLGIISPSLPRYKVQGTRYRNQGAEDERRRSQEASSYCLGARGRSLLAKVLLAPSRPPQDSKHVTQTGSLSVHALNASRR